jgi:nitrate/nitrite transporter NarK
MLTGLGSGAANIAVMGLVSAWFATRRRGLATGIAASGSSLGLILLGPAVPRLLAAYGETGWRVCWYAFGVVTLMVALAALVWLRNRPGEMNLTAFGADRNETPPPHSGRLHWGLIYRSSAIWHLGTVYVAFGFSYIIYLTFFTKRLVAEGGYTPGEAGNLFMLMGWLSLVCGALWGTLSDVIGRKRTLVIVYLLQAVSFSVFALWASPAGFTVSAVLFGLTGWSIPAIMAAACGDSLGPRLAPAALGFITLFFGLGQALAPGTAGLMADSTGSFASAYLLAGLVAGLGAAGAATLPAAAPDSHHGS